MRNILEERVLPIFALAELSNSKAKSRVLPGPKWLKTDPDGGLNSPFPEVPKSELATGPEFPPFRQGTGEEHFRGRVPVRIMRKPNWLRGQSFPLSGTECEGGIFRKNPGFLRASGRAMYERSLSVVSPSLSLRPWG